MKTPRRATRKAMKFGIPALLTLQLMACTAQVKEPAQGPQPTMEAPQGPRLTLFPQIHSNLHGRVREFVSNMHQYEQKKDCSHTIP